MTATLEQPVKYRAPERYQTHDEEDFEVFPDVAVFKEHVNDVGESYDKAKLEAIIEKCNRRISDTGDYATVVVGHTPDHNEHVQPQVIGFAGPYRLGIVGEDDPKWAILADFRIFRKDVETFRSNPRRSVEIWKDKTPDGVEIHFDPIAVLGGVAPKLDLGLVYSKDQQKSERYEMSTPGGTNSFIPTTDGSAKKKPERNNKEQNMLSPEDLGQIMEALKPMVQQMQDEAGGAVVTVPPTPAAPAAAPEVPAAAPAAPPAPNFDPAQMGHMNDKFAKYAKEDEDDDNDGALKYMETFDEEESDNFGKYMADSEDERQKGMYDKLSKYMASDSYEAGGGYKCPDEEGNEKYSAEKYRKEHTVIQDKYRRLSADHSTLNEKYAKEKADNETLRKSEKYSKREAVFTNLVMDGHVLNVADEIKTTEDFTDEQFATHIEKTIPDKYERVPGGTVPIPADEPQPTKNANTEQAEKYSAEAHTVCTKMRRDNPRANVDYQEVHANITKNKGEYVAA